MENPNVTPLRIAIADDEPVSRQRLQRLLLERRDCQLVGEFANGDALVAGLKSLKADLVLLDIEMPGSNGFSSLMRLSEPRPLVVFVTAFSEFAARAYNIDAVDFLMKPVSSERLNQALAKVLRRRSELIGGRAAQTSLSIVRFNTQGRVYLCDQKGILSIEAIGNYVEITTDVQKLCIRTTLAAVHDRLDSNDFFRVHRSWIVARWAPTQITSLPGARHEILLKDGRQVPGGRAYAQNVSALARGYDARQGQLSSFDYRRAHG